MSAHPAGAAGTGAPVPSAMSREAFVARFGGIVEHSPWVAERAWDAGLTAREDTAEGLHAALCAVLRAAAPARQLGVLNAHPDLAGRLAVAGGLTAESAAEQASAGLDRCTPEEFERLQALNARYVRQFGFPFIMAVKGRTRAEILAAFERRVRHGRDEEFATALKEVERIVLLRLRDVLP